MQDDRERRFWTHLAAANPLTKLPLAILGVVSLVASVVRLGGSSALGGVGITLLLVIVGVAFVLLAGVVKPASYAHVKIPGIGDNLGRYDVPGRVRFRC